MVGYYDLVLGLIPTTLFGLAGALYGVGVTLTVAVPIAALLAAGVVGHALFVNAPIGQPPAATSSAASSPSPSAQHAD